MKILQKNAPRGIFIQRVKKYLEYQTPLVLLFAALFVFQIVQAKDDPIISAVQIKGIRANDDFIEIYNPSCSDKDISNWKLRKRTSSGTESSIKVLSDDTILQAKSYFLWSNSDMAEKVKADQSTGATLSENYSIALIDGEKIIDSITWGNNNHPFAGTHLYQENLIASQVLQKDFQNNFKITLNYVPKNSSFINSKELETCPKKEPEPVSKPKTYSGKIVINEIFPAPIKNSEQEEFVELYSASDKLEDLEGWILKDRAGKICKLDGKSIDPEVSRFLVLKNDSEQDCTLALNDTKGEFLGLYATDNENPVSSVSYSGSAKKGLSYNFNGSAWKWSKFLTPGKINIFNNEPFGKIKIDDDIFENVYANFSVSTADMDGDKVKVVWDFGDGHKSYLAKTKHKYKKKGKYEGSLRLSDGSEETVQNFKIKVEEISHPKVRILFVNANPAGSDSDFETITVENRSKKKINLIGWSVATGWKKFVNHPIKENLEIKKNQTAEITRAVSSFTLNNKKDKIELRYPDGKVAYRVKYKKEQGIQEGEVYQKVEGGWTWLKAKQDTIIKKQNTNKTQNTIINIQNDIDIEKINENIVEEINMPVEIEREKKLVLLSNKNVKIELLKNSPRILCSESVREVDGIYFLTPQVVEKEHYAALFFKKNIQHFNFIINMLLN